MDSKQAAEMVNRFWPLGPEWMEKRLLELADLNCPTFRFGTLCKSASGLPVPEVEVGSGSKRLMLTGSMHGMELPGPAGILALLEALLTGRSCEGRDVSSWANEVLSQLTILAFPMMNVEGVARFVKLYPDAWLENHFPNERFPECHKEFWAILWHIQGAPEEPLRRTRRIPPKLWARWKERGWMGTRFTDEGVDIYEDLKVGKTAYSVISKALKKRAKRFRPHFAVDIHADSAKLSTAHAPVPGATPEDAKHFVEIASAMNEAARQAGYPVAKKVTPYDGRAPAYYYHGLKAGTVFLEIDYGIRYPYPKPENLPIAKQHEVIGTTWHMLKCLTEILLEEGQLQKQQSDLRHSEEIREKR